MAQAVTASRLSPRGRMILPLHRSESSPLQRMLNALQPGSYIRPHRHSNPPKSESLIVLQGCIRLILFGADGTPDRCYKLQAGTDRFGADIEAGIYHTFFATVSDTVIYEAKPGPYDPVIDKDFAAWAPAEDSRDAAAYLKDLHVRST